MQRVYIKECKGATGRQCKKTRPTEEKERKEGRKSEKRKQSRPASNNRIRRYFRNSDTDNANKACSSRDSTQDYSLPRIGSSSTSPPSTDVQHQQHHQQQHQRDDRRRTVLAGGHVSVVDMFVVGVGMRRLGFGFWFVDYGEGFEEIFFFPCLWWWWWW